MISETDAKQQVQSPSHRRYAIAAVWVEECDPTQYPELHLVQADSPYEAISNMIDDWSFDDVQEESWIVSNITKTGPDSWTGQIWRGGESPALLCTVCEG